MALLTNPHWDVVPPLLRELLVEIGQEPFSRRFYLAGGTALALRLGHRISVDLDFFSETDELLDDSRAEIVAALQKRRVVDVLEDVSGNLLLEVEGYRVGFFSYGYALLEPPDEVEGVRVASLTDVGLMKLDALVDRGARKDFYDVYFISRHISLDRLLDQSPIKYPYVRGFGMMVLEGMVDFERADQQAPVETIPPVAWETLKEFFVQELRRTGRMWFEPES
jgi:predicted nucleotidyltransferase component of viral defense system